MGPFLFTSLLSYRGRRRATRFSLCRSVTLAGHFYRGRQTNYMFRKLILYLVMFNCVWASSQTNSQAANQPVSSQLMNELTKLRDAALSDDYAYKVVSHLTENIGPRPTGSPQAQAAVQYVAAELKRLGLQVQLEPVQVPLWVRGTDVAEFTDYPGHTAGSKQKIVVTALGGNSPTPPQGIIGEVVVVRNFNELKALGREKVTGKIVLFNVPFDKK